LVILKGKKGFGEAYVGLFLGKSGNNIRNNVKTKIKKYMTTAKYLVATLLLLVTILANASAANICYDKADPALTNLRTWQDLRFWYESYSGCDDGYFAEGISDFVVKSLANRWQTLLALQREITKNSGFKSFVMNHIDATTDENDLRMVVTNSKAQCPSNLRPLCKEIEENAQTALKEIKEIKK
jgi:hypothetical protein